MEMKNENEKLRMKVRSDRLGMEMKNGKRIEW
jgi:hypothetical protein